MSRVAPLHPAFIAEVSTAWPVSRVRFRSDILREEANTVFAGDSGTVSSGYRKGEEVLLDALLLSRCDFLVHSASAVAEFAIYWRLRLHRASVHLQYTERRQRPSWMHRTNRFSD